LEAFCLLLGHILYASIVVEGFFDGHNWVTLPINMIAGAATLRPRYSLNAEWKGHIQAILDLHEEPFIAFEHIHEAKRDRGARFTWIEATIAAELAIKEALSRIEPRLTPLLLEVPAPPLRKLYGAILENVAGERSPYVSKLDKGAEKRNQLVHRPDAIRLDPQEVVDYVAVVDRAIWHLVGLCRRGTNSKLHRAAQRRSRSK
jgi:hypothetical protein